VGRQVKTVIFEFESKDIRKAFLSWFLDGGGDQGLHDALDFDGIQVEIKTKGNRIKLVELEDDEFMGGSDDL